MESFWYFTRYMVKYRTRLIIAISCSLVAAFFFAAGMGLMLPMLRIVFRMEDTLPGYFQTLDEHKAHGLIPDRLIDLLPSDMFKGTVVLVCGFVAMQLLSSATKIVGSFLAFVVCVRTVGDVRDAIATRLLDLSILSLLDEPVAERVSRIMRDSSQLVRGYAALMGRTMGDLFRGAAVLVVAFLVDWKLALLAFGMAPILAAYYRRHGFKTRRCARRVLEQAAKLMHVIEQSLRGHRVVKVHTAEKHEVKRIWVVIERYVNAEIPLRWRRAVASPTIEIITTIGIGFLAMFSAWRIGKGTIESEQVLVCLLCIVYAASTLRQLTNVYNEVLQSAAAADRLKEIFDIEPEKAGDHNKEPLGPFHQQIVFENISFQYPAAEKPTLSDISLQIDQGTTVAFVGPNGCGKTTLLSLIPRLFEPSNGRVLIDGQDIQNVQLESLRKQIGVVTQETVLFQDTIERNIAYGLDDLDIEQVRQVAQQACADDFILQISKGYETIVGDQGLTLSGGERQRVAIARALLRDPAILILDEATSMIDAESEALITEALDKFCHSRTSLVIAHRLSTVVNADRIVVLDQGQLVDVGTHRELLDRCGLYQQLCKTQLVEQDDSRDGQAPQEDSKSSDRESPNIEDLGIDVD